MMTIAPFEPGNLTSKRDSSANQPSTRTTEQAPATLLGRVAVVDRLSGLALKPMSASSLNRLGGTSGGLAPVSDDLRGEVMLSIRRVLSNVVTPDLRWVLVAWTKGQGGNKQVVASYQPATSAGEG